MKKILNGANVQALVLLILSIAASITMIICVPISIASIVFLQLVAFCGILEIRFAYFFALLINKWHSFFKRKNREKVDEEPSKFAIVMLKIFGYLILVIQIVVPLAIVIAWSLV